MWALDLAFVVLSKRKDFREGLVAGKTAKIVVRHTAPSGKTDGKHSRSADYDVQDPAMSSHSPDWYMRQAIELARRNVRESGGPFAALVVRNGEILFS
jgi:hypothetical protein